MLPFVRKECKSGSNGSHMFPGDDMEMPMKGKTLGRAGRLRGASLQGTLGGGSTLGTDGLPGPSVQRSCLYTRGGASSALTGPCALGDVFPCRRDFFDS